jgi:hypothetical protein
MVTEMGEDKVIDLENLAIDLDDQIDKEITKVDLNSFIQYFRKERGLEESEYSSTGDWREISGKLGITAAGISRRGHAYLITTVTQGSIDAYDPFGRFISLKEQELDGIEIMLSKNLDEEWFGLRISKIEFLRRNGYHATLDLEVPEQRDGHNCGPIALYAGLKSCERDPEYSKKLKINELEKIPIDLSGCGD